jgi:hypothetical protein
LLGLTGLDLAALAVVALIAAVNLPFPFNGDQAFFAVGARQVSEGAALYRDFWDLKPPGIFLFYLAGGRLFGFTEIGIHLFEAIVWLIFATTVLVALKPHFSSPSLACLLPLFTAGAYYAVAFTPQLSQVEALVGVPLFLALWLASDPFRSRRGGTPAAYFGSGLAGGVVLLFKFIFLPILLGFWLAALGISVFVRREPARRLALRAALPLAAGMLVPLLAAAVWLARAEALSLALRTFFVYPPKIFAGAQGGGTRRLLDGILWFGRSFAPLAVLAVPGILLAIRRKTEYLSLALLIWIAGGFGVILLQRQSLWDYHYMLLAVPLGILAARGVDDVWSRRSGTAPWNSPRGRVLAALVLVVLCSPVLYKAAKKGLILARHHGARRDEDRAAYCGELNGNYVAAREEARAISEPGRTPGAIYVCGDPQIYYLSGRTQAVALNGWALEFYLPEMWPELNRQLEKAAPPYIFIFPPYQGLIAERSPSTLAWVESRYRPFRRSEAGTWYARRGTPENP